MKAVYSNTCVICFTVLSDISIPIWSFLMFLALCNPTPCLFRHKMSLPMHVGLERFHCICQANMFAKWIILTNCWYPWGCPWFGGCLIRFKRGRCCLWLVPCILWKDARFAFYENTIQWWNEKRCIGCLWMQRILKFNLLKKVFLFTPVSNQYMSLMNTTSNQQMARHKYRDTMFRQDRW